MYAIYFIVQYLLSFSIVVLAVLVFASTIPVQEVNGGGLRTSIGIALSSTCVTMIQNNFSTTCPTMKQLIPLDNSNTYITGDFVYEDGYWQREFPRFINHYRFYDLENDWIYFVDPPGDMRDRIPMIYIESRVLPYLIPGVSFLNDDNSVTFGIERYVDDKCMNATMGSIDWKHLLPDTLNYLRSYCDPTATNYESKIIKEFEKSNQDITTSQKYQDDKRTAWIKVHCLSEYQNVKCKNI